MTPSATDEAHLSLRAVQIVFYRKGVVAQENNQGIKNARRFDAFDLKSLCFIMIASDHDKTEVKPRPTHFIGRVINIPVEYR